MTEPDIFAQTLEITSSIISAPSSGVEMRSALLGAQIQAELRSAMLSAFQDALSRGYSPDELKEGYLPGPEHFDLVCDGKTDVTLFDAVEFCRACRFRLRIGLEILDPEVQGDPADFGTPFQNTVRLVKNKTGAAEDVAEDLTRSVITSYLSSLREKGLVIRSRSASDQG